MRGRQLTCLIAGAMLMAIPSNAAVMVPGEADYGGYLQGHLALAEGELSRAASYFAGALAYAPDDPQLLRRTFDLAIAGGDEALAVKIAERLGQQDRFDSGVTLLLVADALKHRRWGQAMDAADRLSDAGFGSFIVPIIEAWTLEARGKRAQALRRLEAGKPEGFARSYILEHRAHLLFRDRQFAKAAAIYDALAEGDNGRNIRMRIASASAWQAAKRTDAALERLEIESRHPDVENARASIASGVRLLAVPKTAAEGVALLALRMAADLSRERPVPVALTLSRIATFIAPDEAAGWLLTAELLARGDRFESALAAVRMVPRTAPSAALARAQEAAILSRLERTTEAMDILEAATRADGANAEDWAQYGDALQTAKRFDAAAAAYARAIAAGPANPDTVWRLHFLRGSSFEQGGRWPEAEKELREAMRLQRSDASLLNYLGYALLDRGLAGSEARTLIEKAHALAPDDGYITDSLGWAQYRAGEYAAAVETLEGAVASVPDDPVIADHLGDAYWRVGRRLEARHRWKAALQAGPSAEHAAKLEAKYDFGLDVALAGISGAAPRP